MYRVIFHERPSMHKLDRYLRSVVENMGRGAQLLIGNELGLHLEELSGGGDGGAKAGSVSPTWVAMGCCLFEKPRELRGIPYGNDRPS